MFEINKDKLNINPAINPQRAPQKREAPVPLRTPVVRRRKPTTPQPASKLTEIFGDRKSLQFTQGTGFHGGRSRRTGYRLAMWSWLASMIDGLILVSASCVFVLMFSLIVKSSVGSVLAIAHGQSRVLFFAEVYALTAWIYMIGIRSMMGATIGEWACDLRLGQPHERLNSSYVPRVILRSTLIIATGVITLPVFSMIFGKDVPGLCSGLRLFSLK